MISRICESFGCLPSEAARELDENTPLVLGVLEARGDRYWLDLAYRAKKGDEKAAEALQEAPEHLAQTLGEIVMGMHEKPPEDEG